MTKHHKPIALIILDGWGYRQAHQYNPIAQVNTPFIDTLFKNAPHTLLSASGEDVGLPKGQMGNSEVGHLHIGAGRKILQDLTRINTAIDKSDFFKNPTFLKAIQHAKQHNSAIHVMGLLSSGGVHSHERHIKAMMDMLADHAVKKFYFHALLDGRDTPPQSAMAALNAFHGNIVSVCGRYFAMDRDRRWERTKKAYDLLTEGVADYRATTPENALQMAYDRGETDEFVQPTIVGDQATTLQDHDIIIFMNFRADRARQLTQALTDQDFKDFERTTFPKLARFITLTEYDKNIHADIAFPPIVLKNTLGEYIAEHGLKQLRIAETEKYAHVTYFINGGREIPFKNEDRILVPSPKVSTYDLQPEMSAIEVTDKLIKAIKSEKYDLIICNYANPDMIGHTGVQEAAKKAVSVMDDCLHRVIDALKQVNGEALITADHGNIEIMYNEQLQQPHTAHTTNLVPLIYVGRPAKVNATHGTLKDIAPTLLQLMHLPIPKEMTGHKLFTVDKTKR